MKKTDWVVRVRGESFTVRAKTAFGAMWAYEAGGPPPLP